MKNQNQIFYAKAHKRFNILKDKEKENFCLPFIFTFFLNLNLISR